MVCPIGVLLVQRDKLLAQEKKILVICPFPQGVAAGQRLKYEQYFKNWELNNYQVEVDSFMDTELWEVVYSKGHLAKKIYGTLKGYIKRFSRLFTLREFDIVYIFMWVTPIGPSFFERLYRFISKNIIYDLEDNVLVIKSNKLNPVMSFLRGSGKTSYLIKKSDHVITSSPFLNDQCLTINEAKSCTYISSSLDLDRYKVKNDYSNEDKVVIGWTGTFSSVTYLDSLREVFIELNERVNFRLRVIGNFEYDFPEIDLDLVYWSEKDEIKDLSGIDIGVYPLTEDDWVLGKSGLKALQYMAMGLPTVATDVGTTPKIISHMKNGWLVTNTKTDWVNALETLVKDSSLRKNLGSQARSHIEENYSTRVIENNYLKIIKNY